MPRGSNVVSTAENTVINNAFYGEHEPAIDKHLGDLLNWYNAMKEDKDAISYLDSHLNALGRHDDQERLRKVPLEWTPRTAGWLARLEARGFELSEHNVQSIENGLTKAFSHIDDSVVEDPKDFVPNIQQRIREKASDFVGEVNGMLDDGRTAEEIDKWMRTSFPSLPVVRKAIERLSPAADELKLAIKGDDDQIVEAYSAYDRDELLQMHDQHVKALEYFGRFVGDIKATKPRKKRAVNIDKVLSKFQYKKTDEEYKLTSIDPRKVLGAHELWMFNTKYLTLSVLRGSGLGIKGTSITGYDETKSFSKRIGRKTGDVLKTVLSGGKVALRSLADQPLKTNRTSNEIILLRVL